jgi:hypothetical protein
MSGNSGYDGSMSEVIVWDSATASVVTPLPPILGKVRQLLLLLGSDRGVRGVFVVGILELHIDGEDVDHQHHLSWRISLCFDAFIQRALRLCRCQVFLLIPLTTV